MKEQIAKIKESAIQEIENAKTLQELNDVRVKYSGKKGELTAVLKGMKDLSQEERPVIGGLVNDARDSIEELIKQKEEEIKKEELENKLKNEKLDVTMPGNKREIGSVHPITRIIDEVEEIFFNRYSKKHRTVALTAIFIEEKEL